MLIMAHRVNTVLHLSHIPTWFGVEIDVRWDNGFLWLGHDPGQRDQKFVDWILSFNHKFLVVNVKEEGIEDEIVGILDCSGVDSYFFLDQSFPFLIKKRELLAGKSAIRASEYESMDTVKNLANKFKWVWLDSFERIWFSEEDLRQIRMWGFNICLVSPELQGRNLYDEIIHLSPLVDKGLFDAVCTKDCEFWARVK